MSKISADVEVLVPDIASAYKSRMKVADLSSKEEIAILKKQNLRSKKPESSSETAWKLWNFRCRTISG